MIEDDELQRKELSRLLQTAHDEERRELIRKALQSLDGHEKSIASKSDKGNIFHLNPSVQASVFGSGGLPTLETRNARLRPASARRRPSMPNLLDSIPESLNSSKIKEMELPAEEVSEVVTSSFDPKFPASSLFKTLPGTNPSSARDPSYSSPSSSTAFLNTVSPSSTVYGGHSSTAAVHSHSVSSIPEYSATVETPPHNSHSSVHLRAATSSSVPVARQWISTGLVPQFVSVTFYEKWLIRKVEVKCRGVERAAVHINYSAASSFSSAKLVPLVKKGEDRFEAEVMRPTSATDEPVGVHGIGLVIIIQKISGHFCSVSQIRVVVSPQNR